MSLFELGNVSNHRGLHSKSIQFYNDSLAIFEKMGDEKRRLEVLEKLNMIIDDEKSEN